MSGALYHFVARDDITDRQLEIIGHEEYLVLTDEGDDEPEPEAGFYLTDTLAVIGSVHLLPTMTVLTT